MTDTLLLTAARLLEREAASIKDANWVDGVWFDDEPEQQAKADYDEMVEVARLLRAREGDVMPYPLGQAESPTPPESDEPATDPPRLFLKTTRTQFAAVDKSPAIEAARRRERGMKLNDGAKP